MKPAQLGAISLVIGALVLAIDFGLGRGQQAALLFNLAVFTAVIHGCIAIVALVEIVNGKWILPIKKYLLSLYPLFLLSAVLFLFLIPMWGFYKEASENVPNWLNKEFFFARNVGFLLLSFFIGWLYSRESMKNGSKKVLYAIFYMLVFVATNSLIAFDWIMPLEYPWFSTLYGGFFFIESLYTGLICSAFCCFFLYKSKKEVPSDLQKTQYDTGIMLYGWCVLWGYLFFSQLIVQWYGNMPNEASFFIKRVWGNPGAPSPYFPISVAVVFIMFFFPFALLPFKKIKANPNMVTPIAAVVFGGFLMERFLLIRPLVYINIPAMLVELVLLMGLIAFLLKSQGKSKKEELSKA